MLECAGNNQKVTIQHTEIISPSFNVENQQTTNKISSAMHFLVE